MSRTIKGSKSTGYDYWSKRPCSKLGFGKVVKTMTKRVERSKSKIVVIKEVDDWYDQQ